MSTVTQCEYLSQPVIRHPFSMRAINALEVGARLKRTRQALGLSAAEFRKPARIAQNAYSQYETGARPLTLGAAIRLRAAYGLTLDWLFQGDASGLPHALALRVLTEQINEGTATRKRPSPTDGKKRRST